MSENFILETDSYKLGHHAMMQDDTRGVFAYIEARRDDQSPYQDVVFVGLQPLLKRLADVRITPADIEEAEAFQSVHMPHVPFNRAGWYRIVKEHHGRLPVTICAPPEGTVIPRNQCLVTIESTAEPWLVGVLEPTILRQVWYPTTVASRNFRLKRILTRFARMTGSDFPVDFQLHDFGLRGATSLEQARVGGGAHLMVFKGSDTIPGNLWLRDFYHAGLCSSASVAASEHSIMTAKGRPGEYVVLSQLVEKFPQQVLSVVADSYNYYEMVDAMIEMYPLAQANGTHLVIRPDSVTAEHPDPSSLVVWTLRRMAQRFGDKIPRTPEGYKVMPMPVLWGDGIDDEGIIRILSAAVGEGFSSGNLIFGSGGWLLQKCTRDTMRFACKTSARLTESDGWVDQKKEPLDRSKASKAGCVTLVHRLGGQFETVREDQLHVSDKVALRMVFRNGIVCAEDTLDEIRARVDAAVAVHG